MAGSAHDAAFVRSARLTLGLSRRQLAERLGVSVETVRSWEYGRRPLTGPARLAIEMMLEKAAAEKEGAS